MSFPDWKSKLAHVWRNVWKPTHSSPTDFVAGVSTRRRRLRDTARAMSQENVEIVRPIYAALNRRDWDAVFSAVHVDFELPIHRMPEAGTKRGREQVQSFFEEYVAAFDNFLVEPEKFFAGADQVVVFVEARGQIKGGSATVESRHAHVWTVRDGTILSLTMFPKREKALEAVGLSE
jgi:ketosteroid isomerase-like protein